MATIEVVPSVFTYPAPPRTPDEAIRDGTAYRAKGDYARWMLGWHAKQVTEKFGEMFFRQYATAIGMEHASLVKIRWVASRYTPDHVNRFPGLPWSYFEAVAALAEDDLDTALHHLDNAYGAEDLSVEAFKALINGDADTAPVPPPFRAEGKFGIYRAHDGSTIIGVAVSGEAPLWERQVKASPLCGQIVQLSAKGIFV